jgi:hypothetical protein
VIELANESAGDVYCNLYNENGNIVTGNINTRQEWLCPLTGTYYLRIWEYGHNHWTSYQVRILPAYWNGPPVAVWDSDYEPNDNGYTACLICTDNSPQHSHNEEYEDLDWFRFDAVQNYTYVLSLKNELGGNFYFILYDHEFAAISGSQTTKMTWPCLATGLYHVKIWEYGTGQRGSYDFCIDGESICKGDFDSDGDVDGSDLAIFAADFGRTDCVGDCEGDFDSDGDVDGSDLAVFAADFGRTDCP